MTSRNFQAYDMDRQRPVLRGGPTYGMDGRMVNRSKRAFRPPRWDLRTPAGRGRGGGRRSLTNRGEPEWCCDDDDVRNFEEVGCRIEGTDDEWSSDGEYDYVCRPEEYWNDHLVYHVKLKHFNLDGDFLSEHLGKMIYDPLRLGNRRNYVHYSSWFEYCTQCGNWDEDVADKLKTLQPEGVRWKLRGWQCPGCKGEVWWLKEEIYHALLARDVPFYYVSRMGNTNGSFCPYLEERLYLRAVSSCLLCGRDFHDDGQCWNYMMCPPCAKEMALRITNTLYWVDQYPFLVAVNIASFIFRRGIVLGWGGPWRKGFET